MEDGEIAQLKAIQESRLKQIFESGNPLRRVYCVYSMFWRPKDEKRDLAYRIEN